METNTPTVTLTIAPDAGTTFQNPLGTFLLCSEQSDNFYVSVTLFNPLGIRSATAVFRINGDAWDDSSMQSDGNTFYGSTSVLGKNSSIDTVNFYFMAFDIFGDMSVSSIYNASITLCRIIRQTYWTNGINEVER